jgi:hypothetical protein
MEQYIPALSLLTCFLILTVVVFNKIRSEQLPDIFENSNPLVLLSAILFFLLLVTHLFKEQAWTADVLKVLAGVLTGAAASLNAKKKEDVNGVNQTAIGEGIQQAARDINNIKEVLGGISGLKDSVINQYQNIKNSLEKRILRLHSERFKWTSSNPAILEGLKEMQGKYDENLSRKFIDLCLNDEELKKLIKLKVEEWKKDSWEFASIQFDNHTNNSLIVIINFEKEFLVNA